MFYPVVDTKYIHTYIHTYIQETTGHTESVEKMEFGKIEDADFWLKEQYERAAPRWKFM